MSLIFSSIKNSLFNTLPIFFFIINISLKAQDLNARSPKPVAGSHQQQVADKKKLKLQKEIFENTEKSREKHMKLQAKNTKKMMKKSKRASKRWNDNKNEFFLKRWFTKSHH